MKDKRNCSNNNIGYPIYQQPMMVPPMGFPMYQGGMQPNMVSQNTIEQQLNNLEQQITLLDQRLTRLENLNNNTNNKYNNSNYYMV